MLGHAYNVKYFSENDSVYLRGEIRDSIIAKSCFHLSTARPGPNAPLHPAASIAQKMLDDPNNPDVPFV